ncbi:hypothetical protein STPH1_1200 [Streptomyces sp. OM5714]|nr:hypothetical protein STPH1_1200 [Streptomyces sp. OM5714]
MSTALFRLTGPFGARQGDQLAVSPAAWTFFLTYTTNA